MSHEVIVIGAGMGGLSAAAFLAKAGKKVLVLEKHDRPGGYVSSFSREGYTFDTSIAHLNELGAGQTISVFMKHWGGEVPVRRMHFQLHFFIGNREYRIDTRNLLDELCRLFPSRRRQIERYFTLVAAIMRETAGRGPLKPPFAMSLPEKLAFGLRSLFGMPTFMRYGLEPEVEVFRRLLRDSDLESLMWAFYPVHSLSFLGGAWGWEKMRQGEFYYPEGGMQAIPDAAVRAIKAMGGTVLCRKEAARILAGDGRAVGVECADGERYLADIVVANAPIHHTLFRLGAELPQLEPLRQAVRKRRVFVSVFAIYLGVGASYDFHDTDYFFFLDGGTKDIPEAELSPEHCPILMFVSPKSAQQEGRSVTVGAILPYEYRSCWGTGGSRERGAEYRKIKEEAKRILLRRICDRMGPAFESAIRYELAATPLTFERYTHNEKGAIMGWAMDRASYGKFIPFATPLHNLYLVGMWVFPGGGVPAVMGSGYFVAQEIMRREGRELGLDSSR